MKKLLALLISLVLVLSFTACGGETTLSSSDDSSATSQSEESKEKVEESESSQESATDESNQESAADESSQDSTPDENDNSTAEEQTEFGELEGIVSKDVEDTIDTLIAEYEELVTDIDTYDKYKNNTDKIEAFYNKILEDTANLCIRLREYSIDYAEIILASDKSRGSKYDDCEEIYDCIYDDAGDDVYDNIYDDLFDDLYDAFYDGILSDAYDTVSYGEWSDAHSNEYDWWSDTHSDVYDEWSDFRSDVYDFWSDISGELWDDDMERAQKKLNDFQEDVEKLKGKR